MRVKKGDLVEVVAGKELGKRGKVLRVISERQRAAVEKLNLIKRHTRPTKQSQKGGIVEKEGTIHLANLMLVCGKCNAKTRVGHHLLEDGRKVRVCCNCGEDIE